VLGPGRHNLSDVPQPRPQLDLPDHPRSAELDECLAGEDGSIPHTIMPPRPRDRELGVLDLGHSAPGTINAPPRQVIRRCGPGAELTGIVRRKRDKLDPLREAFGAEYFDAPEPELEAPAAIADPGAKPVDITELARRLERKPNSIHKWIKSGTIPDSPIRTPGKTSTSGLGITTTSSRRLWSAAEADELVKIAAQEHIIGTPRRPIGETNFSMRAWDARRKQQAREGN
jgi:hypothetical protein